MIRSALALAAVSLLTAAAIAPLSAPWFIGSHDGVLAVARSVELARLLGDGAVPPRWAPDWFFGYGYPFFSFYAPLGYLLAAVPILLGAFPADAVEWVFAFGLLAGSWGAYCWLQRHLGIIPSLVGAVAYAYVPYRIVDVHFRGDFSELLALSWFPWLLWAIDRAIDREPRAVPVLAVAQAVLPLTHNVMALILAPAGLAYAATRLAPRLRRPRREVASPALLLAAGLAAGLGLSAFFWAPALIEKDSVQIENVLKDPTVDFRRNFPTAPVTWSLVQPYGSHSNGEYRYEVSAGGVQVALTAAGALAFAAALVVRRKPIAGLAIWAYSVVGLGALAYLMHPVSLPLWEAFPLMEFVQFPWRLLGPAGLLTSALLALLVSVTLPRVTSPFDRALIAGVALFLAIAPNVLAMQPRYSDLSLLDSRAASGGFDPMVARRGVMLFEAASQAIGTTSIGDYLPDAVQIRPLVGRPLIDLVTGAETAVAVGPDAQPLPALAASSVNRAVAVSETTEAVFAVPDWPGWEVTAAGGEARLGTAGPLGLISARADRPGAVSLRFQGTALQRAAEWLSLVVAIGLAGAFAWSYRRPRPGYLRQAGLATGGFALVAAAGWLAWLPGAYLMPDPALGDLAEVRPLDVRYADELSLIGYRAEPNADGTALAVELRWLTVRPPSADYTAFVHLVNVADQVVSTFDKPLGQGVRGASRWQIDEINSQAILVPIPPGTPPGVYHLRVGIYDPRSLQRAAITAEQLMPALTRDGPLRLGPILLTTRHLGQAAATVQPPVAAPQRFEEIAWFRGFEVRGGEASDGGGRTIRPGDGLDVSLYFEAIGPIVDDYTVFVHLLDAENRVVAQDDRPPAGGSYPTFVWQRGEWVVDRHRLSTRPDLPPGDYELEVGLYNSVTKQRLGVDDGHGSFAGDRIVIGRVSVVPR